MQTYLRVAIIFFSFSAFATEKVEGPWINGRSHDYRYVTTYDVKFVKKPLKNFPWIEEDCHDQGGRFAAWSQTISYDVTYGGSIGFNLLGFVDVDLGNERSRSHQFTFERWITPTLGIKARHVLHEEYEVWTGSTVKEYRYGTSIETDDRISSFGLDKVNYGLSVVRTLTGECPGYEAY